MSPSRTKPKHSSRLVSLLTVALLVSGCLLVCLNYLHHEQMPSSLERSRVLEWSKTARKGSLSSNKTSKVTPQSASTKVPQPPADGTFNSMPVYYKTNSINSTYGCVGENFRNDAWLYRSCFFQNLCFDMVNQSFVIFQTPEEAAFSSFIDQSTKDGLTHISSTGTPWLSLGGVNPKWRKKARESLRWFPQIRTEQPPHGHYELSDTVWLPFHSFAGYNAGHLFWDDMFPIFKLLTMFDLVQRPLLLTKIELKLWGTCDWNPKNTETCRKTFAKFLPAMGLTNQTFSSTYDFRFDDTSHALRRSNYVCAPHGAAGLGMLTDHGLKMHGWDEEDMETTHNAGRGNAFYAFRRFMMKNLDIPEPERLGPPYKVVFSRFSSSTKGRVKGFGKQENLLRQKFDSNLLNITGYRMSKLSLRDQALEASKASIFITSVGGGSMTATFLPRGATLILYYEATGGRRNSKDTGKPARLDWDVLNHASALRVHWLPIETLDNQTDLKVFEELVRHELRIMDQAQAMK